MNTLLVLYLIYLSWGTAGQGRVSILEMSRYLRMSKTATRNRMLAMAKDDLIEVIETFSDKGSKKLLIQLSDNGQDFLMQNFSAAIDTYHAHVRDTIAAINMRYKEQPETPRKMSKRDIAAIASGQKELPF